MMNSKQKQKKLSRNISVALAVLIVATLCVTIAALTAARRSKPDPSPSTNPTVNTDRKEPTSNNDPKPTDPSQSHETPGNSTDSGNKPAVSVIEWMSPTAGHLLKDYSADIPVFSTTMEDYRIHAGIDIAGDAGDAVYAAADGVIEDIYYDPMMGQTIIIKHNDSYTTVYQNLQTIIPEGIEKGAAVSGGDKIGSVGDTALIEISESPHLHFCVLMDGKSANPLSYITVAKSASSVWYED